MRNNVRSEQVDLELAAAGDLRRDARRTTGSRRLAGLMLMVLAPGPGLGGRAAEAQSPAASQCPPMLFLSALTEEGDDPQTPFGKRARRANARPSILKGELL